MGPACYAGGAVSATCRRASARARASSAGRSSVARQVHGHVDWRLVVPQRRQRGEQVVAHGDQHRRPNCRPFGAIPPSLPWCARRDIAGTLSPGAWCRDDARWDRAVGPLQFIPSTWRTRAADANGDGVADPDQVDDAALAAGRYLCHSGELTDAAAWRRAVFSFNHSDAYVDDIAGLANTYAQRSG